MSMPRVRPLADLLRLFVGPSLWFAHFTVIYGAEALTCRAPAATAGRIMISIGAVATLAALAALIMFAAMLLRTRPASDEATGHTGEAFLRDAALLLALLSVLGVIWIAAPIAVLPVGCAPPG